ncbi:hypothetical protein M2426_001270 [Pseudomonas moraviensis]|uniref:hypothetical protein n=1 Tax=Pseudomonas moraviensis TaxID=321662 RepID=UPI003D1B30B8
MTALRSSVLDPHDSFFPGDYQPYTKVASPERSVSYYFSSIAAAGIRLLTQAPIEKKALNERWRTDIREHAKEDFVQEHLYYLLQRMNKELHRQRFCIEVTQKGNHETYCMSIDALFEHSHMELRSALMHYHALPGILTYNHTYNVSYKRLREFAEEQENWDGYGGVAALPEVVEEVHALLGLLSKELIPEPSLAMGGDGSVALFWSSNGYYISLEIDGSGDYIYLITKDKEFLCDGDSSSEVLEPELKKYLKKIFTDEQR